MKAAVYIRVSREDLHAENQEIQLREFCAARGLAVTETYIDHISGAKEHRPALNKLLVDAREKKFEGVVVWKLDRLGRSLQHLIKVVQYFEKHGINFICSTQNIDTTTASGKLIFYIFGAMAEFERALISERTKAGLARARQNGKQIGRRAGQKDAKARKVDGYKNRWAKARGEVEDILE